MLRIFSAEICPFAQRTRALLAHLGQRFEVREVDLRDRDPELLRLSPTGRVPLLVEPDGFTLYESSAVNDYLAERLGWSAAYADDPRVRARQRLAMMQWDAVVSPVFYRALLDPDTPTEEQRQRAGRELDELARTLAHMEEGAVECLLAFHVAPFWARMQWLRRHAPDIPRLIEERPAVKAWLDRTVAIPAVRSTLPDRDAAVRLYEEHYVSRRKPAAP